MEYRKVLFRSPIHRDEVPIIQFENLLYIQIDNLPESILFNHLKSINSEYSLVLETAKAKQVRFYRLQAICNLMMENTVRHPEAETFVSWVNNTVRLYFLKRPEGVRPYETAEVVG
jgi:prophage antirepressor-like protein